MNTPPPTLSVPLVEDAEGVLRVSGSRVSLDAILEGFGEGATAEELALRHPTVELADLYAIIGYALRHPEAVSAYLGRRRAEALEVRLRNEARFDPAGIRERLLARRVEASGGRQDG